MTRPWFPRQSPYHAGYLTEDSDRIIIDPESGGFGSRMGQLPGSAAMRPPAMRRRTTQKKRRRKGSGARVRYDSRDAV